MKLSERFKTEVKCFENPEEGEYLLKLKEIEPCVVVVNDKPQNKLRWKFETIMAKDKECSILDSQGNPFSIQYTTGLTYTCNEKANLTKLIKGLFGNPLTLQEFAALDEGDLIGKEVIGLIQIDEKDNGCYSSIAMFKAIARKPATAAPVINQPLPVAPEPIAAAVAPVKNEYAKYADEAAAVAYMDDEEEDLLDRTPF